MSLKPATKSCDTINSPQWLRERIPDQWTGNAECSLPQFRTCPWYQVVSCASRTQSSTSWSATDWCQGVTDVRRWLSFVCHVHQNTQLHHIKGKNCPGGGNIRGISLQKCRIQLRKTWGTRILDADFEKHIFWLDSVYFLGNNADCQGKDTRNGSSSTDEEKENLLK